MPACVAVRKFIVAKSDKRLIDSQALATHTPFTLNEPTRTTQEALVIIASRKSSLSRSSSPQIYHPQNMPGVELIETGRPGHLCVRLKFIGWECHRIFKKVSLLVYCQEQINFITIINKFRGEREGEDSPSKVSSSGDKIPSSSSSLSAPSIASHCPLLGRVVVARTINSGRKIFRKLSFVRNESADQS